MSHPAAVPRFRHWAAFRSRPLTYDRHNRLRQVAKLLTLSAVANGRLEWFLWKEEHQATVATTCRRFGIAPKTYHKWAKRFEETNLRLLEDAPKSPVRKRQPEYTPLQYSRVVGLRRQFLHYGKEKLLRRYQEEFPGDHTLTRWHVQCMIQRAGLFPHPRKHQRTQAKRRSASAKKRITELRVRKHQGFLFCLDTVVRYWAGTKRYVFTAIDRSAKLAFARMYPSKSSKNAAEFLSRLLFLATGKIENVGHDNGSEFQGAFAAACQASGIPQYHSRVRTPKDNAVNERFNRTLQEEFLEQGNMTTDTTVFNRRLTEWLIEYNFRRPHASLGYVSPINFIYRHHRLLPMTPSDTQS